MPSRWRGLAIEAIEPIFTDISEDQRLAALADYAVLDTPPETGFDDIVLIASSLCQCPVSLVSLVDRDRQWFKARLGFDCAQTPLSQSVCAYALRQDGVLVIPDLTADPRTHDNLLVVRDPHIRFYAGALLETAKGERLGTLCVIDTEPRPEGLSAPQTAGLEALARQVMAQLELRRALAQRDHALADRALVERELVIAKEVAEAANLAKSLFLTNMSHELRTPLSAVIGYSEMLQEEAEDIALPSLVTDLGKIKSNATHLLDLINNLLDLSKIEAGKMDIVPERFDVADMAADVAATVTSLVKKKHNSLSVIVGEDAGSMTTDLIKVRQCLFNLIGNAAKFIENGNITLLIGRELASSVVSFRVTDTGMGMTEEQLSRLFERFVQAESTISQQFGGSGLGLALTKGFCELLGGTIAVESIHGAGTSFTIRIPAFLPDGADTAS